MISAFFIQLKYLDISVLLQTKANKSQKNDLDRQIDRYISKKNTLTGIHYFTPNSVWEETTHIL